MQPLLRLILFTAVCALGLAQHPLPPPMYVFTSKDYKVHPQIFCIDHLPKHNTLLLGTIGILRYAGTSFHSIRGLEDKYVFSIAHTPKEDTIFVGCISDFGYLAPDSVGTLSFHSLVDKIPDSLKYFNIIRKTYYANGYAIFQSRIALFIYSIREDSVYIVLPPEKRFWYAHAVNDTTIWAEEDGVLYELILRPPFRFRQLKWSVWMEEIAGVMEVLTLPQGKLLITDRNGLFLLPYNKDTLIPVAPKSKFLANEYHFHSACKVNDTIIAVGTPFNGVYLINIRSDSTYSINRKNGLPNNYVWDIAYTGSFLVVATDNGFALIRYPSAIHFIEEGKFYQGTIQDIGIFSENLFITTLQGVYYLPLNTHLGDKLHFIEGTEGQNAQCTVIPDKGIIVAGGIKGMLFIQKHLKSYIARAIEERDIYAVFYAAPYLVAGGRDGIVVYKQQNNNFKQIAEYNEVPEEIASVLLDTSTKWVVAGLITNGILIGKLQEREGHFSLVNVKHLDASSLNIPQGSVVPVLTSKGILLGTEGGLFRLRIREDTLYAEPFCELKEMFCDTTLLVFPLKEEVNGVIWVCVTKERQGEMREFIYKLTPSPSGYRVDSLFSFAINIGTIRSIYPDGKGGLWIGGDFGLAHYSPHRKENFLEKYPCIIEKVSTFLHKSKEGQKDSLLWGGWGKIPKLVLPYAFNNITFEWVAPYYYHQDKVEYRYMLEGFDESWSAYTKETRKEYTNLPPGEYTFRVQARNVYGVLSEEAVFSFRVLPPWYMTWWAYTLYALVSTSLVVAVVWLSILRIEAKRKEKAYIAEIERLSLVARETSNAVYICHPDGEIFWVNEAFKRFTGYEDLETFKRERGKTIQSVSNHPDIEQLWRRCVENLETVAYETLNVRRDGSKLYVHTTLTPVVREGILHWVAAIDTDITALQQEKQKVEEAYEELEQAHKELAQAHNELEEAHRNIQDSITYASYIQRAFLPSEQYCKEVLGEHFILYLPRDVVSGDFYWVYKDGDTVLFAACDCTGHGVPGAFMSMVCNDILNQLVIEQGLRSPAEILNETRKRVISIFSRSGEEPRPDGMDCALCLWDKRSNTLTFAGASRPLYLCRSEGADLSLFNNRAKVKEGIEEVIIIHGDKMAVGYEAHVSLEKDLFSEITFQVYPGDMLYLCSDGYADQIGGERGKRLGIKRFVKLLHHCYKLPPSEQKKVFQSVLLKWRGDYYQIDDILLMGIRIV